MFLEFGCALHVSLHYHILSFLDLGLDAASLWIPHRQEPPWAAGLAQSLQKTPARPRLQLQILPLHTAHWDAYCAALDAHDEPVYGEFLQVAEALYGSFARRWSEEEARCSARIHEALPVIAQPLEVLRAGLWGEQSPPPLYILDASALTRNGRAVSLPQARCCAVSFDNPHGHILCQIFHEETHVLSDPRVLAHNASSAPRDTSASKEGYGLHLDIERAALDLGAQIVEAHAPQWSEAYRLWAAPFDGI